MPEVSDKGLNNSLEAMDGLHLGTKERVSLPLATGDTEFVSLEYRDGASGQKSPHILLWKDKQATEPRFIIPLKGSVIVNNITEIGYGTLVLVHDSGQRCPSPAGLHDRRYKTAHCRMP